MCPRGSIRKAGDPPAGGNGGAPPRRERRSPHVVIERTTPGARDSTEGSALARSAIRQASLIAAMFRGRGDEPTVASASDASSRRCAGPVQNGETLACPRNVG